MSESKEKVYVLDLASGGATYESLKARVEGMEHIIITEAMFHVKADVKAEVTGQAGKRLYTIQCKDGSDARIGADCLCKLALDLGLPLVTAQVVLYDNKGKKAEISGQAFTATPVYSALVNAYKRQSAKR